MKVVDLGSGPPIVLVPGIQGRWEWMKPAVDALAPRCRVVTFSLSDEPTCGGRFDEANGFDCYVDEIRDAMDQAGVRTAVICGVSYGGLVAAAFAARYPERTRALVLVSAIGPSWAPDARVRFFLRAPRLLMPAFMVASLRMLPEIAAARPGLLNTAATASRHAWNVLTHMFSPVRMARRVRLLASVNLSRELRTVSLPTLVLTGERGLDRVVPIDQTEEYLRIWPHAERATLPHTGHLGCITRPHEFAAVIVPFVERHATTGAVFPDSERRRIG